MGSNHTSSLRLAKRRQIRPELRFLSKVQAQSQELGVKVIVVRIPFFLSFYHIFRHFFLPISSDSIMHYKDCKSLLPFAQLDRIRVVLVLYSVCMLEYSHCFKENRGKN